MMIRALSCVLLMCVLLGASTAAYGDSLACTEAQITLGTCEEIAGSVGPGEVVLEGHAESNSGLGSDDNQGAEWGQPERRPLPAKGMTVEECSTTMHPECVMSSPPAEPATPAPGTPAVTLRDIASFRPAQPSDVMEPNGWAIEGLPANFVANASPEVVAGTLLGQPADVRFTPVGYRWVHSDGAIVASASPGATWSALGVAEFTPTDTSHAYAESGEYTVTLQVRCRRRVPLRRIRLVADHRHTHDRRRPAARARRRGRHGAHRGRLHRVSVEPRLLTSEIGPGAPVNASSASSMRRNWYSVSRHRCARRTYQVTLPPDERRMCRHLAGRDEPSQPHCAVERSARRLHERGIGRDPRELLSERSGERGT